MIETMEVDHAKYELIFDAALSMSRSAVPSDGSDDGEQAGIAKQIAGLLFQVANSWEKDPVHFPPIVLQAACDVAVAWDTLTLDPKDVT